MTRRGKKILRGAPKIFTHPKGGLWKNCWARRGGSENLYTLKPTGWWVGAPKNWTASEWVGWGGGGAAKISSFEFQYLYPPCHIKWTFPYLHCFYLLIYLLCSDARQTNRQKTKQILKLICTITPTLHSSYIATSYTKVGQEFSNI